MTKPQNDAYCNALLLAHWSVFEKLNHVIGLVQFSYVGLYASIISAGLKHRKELRTVWHLVCYAAVFLRQFLSSN